MSVQFIFKDNTVEVECFFSLNLLAHAQLEEIDLGSSCGGHGICGGDKIQVETEGNELSPLTEAEKDHLSESEINAGWRLGCQCWPLAEHQKINVWCR
jgi:ferredoxin